MRLAGLVVQRARISDPCDERSAFGSTGAADERCSYLSMAVLEEGRQVSILIQHFLRLSPCIATIPEGITAMIQDAAKSSGPPLLHTHPKDVKGSECHGQTKQGGEAACRAACRAGQQQPQPHLIAKPGQVMARIAGSIIICEACEELWAAVMPAFCLLLPEPNQLQDFSCPSCALPCRFLPISVALPSSACSPAICCPSAL